MKKAVIATGGKQYIVAEGDVIDVELLDADKTIEFEPLLVYGEEGVSVGKPTVKGVKVIANVEAQEVKQDKVVSIRYKAKKRVNKKRGHRQLKTTIKITKIT